MLFDIGGKINDVTNKRHKGGVRAYLCLPHMAIKSCEADKECSNTSRCSNIYGLLKDDEKICIPSILANIKREIGEKCLSDAMCSSSQCSEHHKCEAANANQAVTEKKNNPGFIHKRTAEAKPRVL